MNIEEMYVPTGLKTVDGKDIMGFNGAYYLQNKEKINKMLKKYADIIIEEDEEEKQRENKYILKENTEKYSINKKHDKMFKEILSDKKETVEFINSFLHLNLIEDDIEKSKNKEELYKNIEDVINIQKEKNTFDNLQLEKLIKYELSETEDKNIMNEFIEKIRNMEGRDEIMTNASRIINREIRKQRKAGLEQGLEQGFKQGIIQIAKKLKREMSIKDISRITGLIEQEIENL